MTYDASTDTTCCVLQTCAADTTENLITDWSAMGYFQNVPWAHPEIPYRQQGFSGTPLQYTFGGDIGLVALAFFCIFVFIFTLYDVKDNFRQASKSFFFPSMRASDADDGENGSCARSALALSVLMCLLGGTAAFMYFSADGKAQTDGVYPYLYTGIYAGVIAAYIVFRYLACTFIHWVFFDKSRSSAWHKANYYIVSVESLLCLPVIILSLFGCVTMQVTLICLLTVVSLSKSLSLYKTFRIFSGKIYGLLHLFAYLCTLELMPLLALVKALTLVTLG